MSDDRFRFRAWHTPRSKMVGPFGIGLVWENLNEHESPVEWANWIIMQCTGLKDKNGKVIWEGDVVAICGRTDLCAAVVWNNDTAAFATKRGDIISDHMYAANWACRVIGNIYEHPDLLK
jgi:hypothetical protein